MHLRDAHMTGDLVLRQVGEEAEVDDLSLAAAEAGEALPELDAVSERPKSDAVVGTSSSSGITSAVVASGARTHEDRSRRWWRISPVTAMIA